MVGKVLRYFQVLSLFLFCKQLFDEDYVLNVIFIMGGISVISRGLFLFCLTVSLVSARGMQLLLFARSQPSSGGRFTGMSFFFRFTSGSKKLSFWTNCAYCHGDSAALAFCRSSRKLSFCSVGVLRMRSACCAFPRSPTCACPHAGGRAAWPTSCGRSSDVGVTLASFCLWKRRGLACKYMPTLQG